MSYTCSGVEESLNLCGRPDVHFSISAGRRYADLLLRQRCRFHSTDSPFDTTVVRQASPTPVQVAACGHPLCEHAYRSGTVREGTLVECNATAVAMSSTRFLIGHLVKPCC